MRDDDFERLYEAEAQGLFGFLAYRTGDRALAEDLLADTFERALRARRASTAARGSEKTWLYAIALNLLRDHARRRGRGGARASSAPAHAAPAAATRSTRSSTATSSQRALAALAEEEREAIALRFGADLTVPRWPSCSGEPLTTVEGRVYRALRKLRERVSR